LPETRPARGWPGNKGRAAGAQMVALTEMFVTGYQTQDLVMKPAFAAQAERAVAALAARIVDGPAWASARRTAATGSCTTPITSLRPARIAATVLKHDLPNDGVFDEKRIFASAPLQGPYRVGPLRIGSPICEDAWHADVSETLAESGAQILLVPNGSPYHRGKPSVRTNLMVARVVETGLPLVYLNMIGGQDDQVFDGASFVLNPGGALAVQMPQFCPA
jgi:NAD+ synthase